MIQQQQRVIFTKETVFVFTFNRKLPKCFFQRETPQVIIYKRNSSSDYFQEKLLERLFSRETPRAIISKRYSSSDYFQRETPRAIISKRNSSSDYFQRKTLEMISSKEKLLKWIISKPEKLLNDFRREFSYMNTSKKTSSHNFQSKTREIIVCKGNPPEGNNYLVELFH